MNGINSKPSEDSTINNNWSWYAKELLDIASSFSGKAIVAPNTPHDKECAKIVAFKFAQAVRTFRAIIVLCERGDAYDAFILGRALLENFVDAVFLVRNPKEVWRYLEEAAELEAKIVSSSTKYGPPPRHTWHAASRRPSPEDLRRQFGDLAARDSKTKSWRKLSLRARVDGTSDPGLIALYEMVYPIASSYTHGASTIVLDYLRPSKGPQEEFRVEYQGKETEVGCAWSNGTLCFLQFIGFLNSLFGLQLDKRIEDLDRKHSDLTLKTLSPTFPELLRPCEGNSDSSRSR